MFIKKVSFDFKNLNKNSYLRQLPYYTTKEISFTKNIIFLTGDNGVGKTTLLEALAYEFNLNRFGGSKNFILDEENKPEMIDFIRLSKSLDRPKDAFFFRSDSFFNLEDELVKYGSNYEYYDDRSFKKLSHGEGFMTFFKNRITQNGIYFFDEPETALSFDNQILFLFLLKQFELDNNQIIIITHSPVLLSYPECQIFHIDESGIEERDYEETNQFKNTKNFLENYKHYQKEIEKFE